MSLLVLEEVTRRVRRGAHERTVLRDVSLRLDGGELLAVWGVRRSGRSTLLRVAAGIEPPDAGVVRFAGRPLRARSSDALGSGIGYCQRSRRGGETQEVLDELMLGQLAHGITRPAARARAQTALERTGAGQCAARRMRELDDAEALRVAIARALSLSPLLLVIDEPTKGVDLLERDAILGLLRSLADEGMGVLISAGEATALSGADRALSLADGELRGSVAPELAPVLPLRRQASV
jgi:putative ABC transport system ATP-binding protein